MYNEDYLTIINFRIRSRFKEMFLYRRFSVSIPDKGEFNFELPRLLLLKSRSDEEWIENITRSRNADVQFVTLLLDANLVKYIVIHWR